MRLSRRLVTIAAAATGVVALSAAAVAGPHPSAAAPTAGSVVRPVHPNVAWNAQTSGNWFGYNRSALPQKKLFTTIQGTWRVPTATQHKGGEAEHSSTWIGIGGGCLNANCTVGDNTLIQTGTEQDVDASGHASYSAWWEIIPGPSISTNLVVHPGDKIRAYINEQKLAPGVWTIKLTNLTTGKGFQQVVPYSSTKLTAEWIEETPLTFGTGGTGLAALPNLTKATFDNALLNGANPHLKSSERILLAPDGTHVIGTPSNPQADGDGFGACAWATSCSVPGEL